MASKMLVPLDGSELAEAAVPYAERIGKALGWDALLLHVVPLRDVHERPLGHAPIEAPLDQETNRPVGPQLLREEEAAAMEQLDGPAQRLRAAGLGVQQETGVGDARDFIVGRAAQDDVAMIVMASHGRTGLARLFRGSVAAGVVEAATRPTLVVRPFRDAESRVDLEHAERLPPDQADAVRRAVDTLAT